MSTQIATNKSQSDRLVACGVAAHTADMSIRTIIEPALCEDVAWHTPMLLTLPYSEANDIYKGDEVNPAWSLSALLAMLPRVISDENTEEFYFSLAQEYATRADYNAAYLPCWFDGDALVAKCAPCPIEACVSLIEAIVAKGYLTK